MNHLPLSLILNFSLARKKDIITTIKAFIKGYPVLIYYILTFAISWGGMLLVIGGPGGIPATQEQFQILFPFTILVLLAGPSLAGILLIGLDSGKVGFSKLLSRFTEWRVGIYWYGVALFIAPLLMAAIPFMLLLISQEFLPGIISSSQKVSLLLMGVAAGLGAGFFEELGWSGFVLPKLRLRYSVLTTGLMMGFLWGLWHLIVNFWSSGTTSGALSIALLLHSVIFSIGILPAYRILMVWIYDGTESLLIAILMHMSLTFSNVIFVPQTITGLTGSIWSLLIAIVLWIIVAAGVKYNREQLSRQPIRNNKIKDKK